MTGKRERGGQSEGEGAREPKKAPIPEGEEKPGSRPRELGGPGGPEPTRYGDWEQGGRCTDF